MTKSLHTSRIILFSISLGILCLHQLPAFSNLNSYRQKNSPIPTDSVNIYSDTSIAFTPFENSTFQIDDSLKNRTDNFYDTLRHRADKRRFTREILDLIILTPSNTNGANLTESETPFIEYHNKIIRSISFNQLPVFGPTVDDTTIQATRFYEKTGNKLHINTSKNVLSRNLLIKPGDRLNAYTLADNERLIRSLPYIHDVKFIVSQTHPLSDSVDIIALVKDLWSLGFSIELSGTTQGNIGIWHKNLFGMGNEEKNNIYWNTGQKHLLGYEGSYRITNLAGIFVKSEFRYANYFGTRQILADFHRKFFTPEIKYAGGLKLENKKTIQDIVLIDTTLFQTHYNFTSYDMWIGRAFALKNNNIPGRKRSNLMFAGRVFSIYYHDRPEVERKYLYTFHNRTQLLASAAFSTQGFYKSHLVYSFGQTEDIPYGYLVQLMGGYEFNEYAHRPYLGFAFSHGTYLWRKGGYLYNRFETGSYIANSGFEQGLFSITTKYFTPLVSSNRFKFRYFLTFNYKTGIQRYREEYISIENNHGLVGLHSTNLKGIQKMTMNIEIVSFTPYYLMGFRFAFFGFTDSGLIGPGGKSIFNNNLYTGLGVGVRLRNERLVFNTLQIKFALYPLAPDDAKWQYLQVSGEQKLQMDNFYISDPVIIEY